MDDKITREDLEAEFGTRYTRVAAFLKDISRCTSTSPNVDNMHLDDVEEVMKANYETVQVIIDDTEQALKEYDDLEKEIRSYFRSLEKPQQQVFNAWYGQLTHSTKIDAIVKLVKKKKRDHVTIALSNRAAAAKAAREIERRMAHQAPVPAVEPAIRSEARLAPIELPYFSGNKLQFNNF